MKIEDFEIIGGEINGTDVSCPRCKQLNQKLSALTAERDKLKGENEALKEIARLSDAYLGDGCCEEHERQIWNRLLTALRKNMDIYVEKREALKEKE